MKGERMAKRSSFGNMVRRRLSDITNSQPQKEEKVLPQMSPATEDFVNQLIKEKLTLMKLIEERNKIIELSAMEVHNLKGSLQKLQMQNWNLAQSNSLMLAEVNMGRERMKALQHEVLCRDALIKATRIEKEVNKKEGDKFQHNNEKPPCKANRSRNARSQSMGASTTSQRPLDKERTENKRRCVRRQSAKFKSDEQENFFEINDASFISVTQQQPDTPMQDSEETTRVPSKRSSVGRPLRRAAEKVHSYKEVPLNIKMRRD